MSLKVHTNLKMIIAFAFVLKVIFLLPTATGQGAPQVVCELTDSPDFPLSDLPTRCHCVAYGYYYIDQDPPFFGSDENVISTLVTAEKSVYVFVGFQLYNGFPTIFDAQDMVIYIQVVDPLKQFIMKNKITGIIFNFLDVYYPVEDYASKISRTITKIQGDIPGLKIGILLNGELSDKFTNKNLFDFTITNSVVEFYLIGTNGSTACTEEALVQGTTPIAYLEILGKAVSGSSMAMSKLLIRFPISIHKPKDLGAALSTYSEYCSAVDHKHWCAETTTSLKDKAVMLKGYFYGISLSYLNYDDFDGKCECQNYVITNTLLDTWENKTITGCPKLDTK